MFNIVFTMRDPHKYKGPAIPEITETLNKTAKTIIVKTSKPILIQFQQIVIRIVLVDNSMNAINDIHKVINTTLQGFRILACILDELIT